MSDKSLILFLVVSERKAFMVMIVFLYLDSASLLILVAKLSKENIIRYIREKNSIIIVLVLSFCTWLKVSS